MGNGQYRINIPGSHLDSGTEVHPTVLPDVTVAASDSEAYAVEHAKQGSEAGHNVTVVFIFFHLYVDCIFDMASLNYMTYWFAASFQ